MDTVGSQLVHLRLLDSTRDDYGCELSIQDVENDPSLNELLARHFYIFFSSLRLSYSCIPVLSLIFPSPSTGREISYAELSELGSAGDDCDKKSAAEFDEFCSSGTKDPSEYCRAIPNSISVVGSCVDCGTKVCNSVPFADGYCVDCDTKLHQCVDCCRKSRICPNRCFISSGSKFRRCISCRHLPSGSELHCCPTPAKKSQVCKSDDWPSSDEWLSPSTGCEVSSSQPFELGAAADGYQFNESSSPLLHSKISDSVVGSCVDSGIINESSVPHLPLEISDSLVGSCLDCFTKVYNSTVFLEGSCPDCGTKLYQCADCFRHSLCPICGNDYRYGNKFRPCHSCGRISPGSLLHYCPASTKQSEICKSDDYDSSLPVLSSEISDPVVGSCVDCGTKIESFMAFQEGLCADCGSNLHQCAHCCSKSHQCANCGHICYLRHSKLHRCPCCRHFTPGSELHRCPGRPEKCDPGSKLYRCIDGTLKYQICKSEDFYKFGRKMSRVVSGGYIYMIGGFDRRGVVPSTRALRFKIGQPLISADPDSYQISPMNSHKGLSSIALEHKGIIYVLANYFKEKPEHTFESYNTEKDKWEPLVPPHIHDVYKHPSDRMFLSSSLVDDKIYVSTMCYAYVYHISRKRWEACTLFDSGPNHFCSMDDPLCSRYDWYDEILAGIKGGSPFKLGVDGILFESEFLICLLNSEGWVVAYRIESEKVQEKQVLCHLPELTLSMEDLNSCSKGKLVDLGNGYFCATYHKYSSIRRLILVVFHISRLAESSNGRLLGSRICCRHEFEMDRPDDFGPAFCFTT